MDGIKNRKTGGGDGRRARKGPMMTWSPAMMATTHSARSAGYGQVLVLVQPLTSGKQQRSARSHPLIPVSLDIVTPSVSQSCAVLRHEPH